MNQYLIYDYGFSEQGSESRWTFYRYYICNGDTELEAVEDWIRQSPFENKDVICSNGKYLTERSFIEVVPLISASNEFMPPTLKWQ